MEAALGAKFNQKKFHDFILAQGLLPPDLMRKAVMEDFVKQSSDARQLLWTARRSLPQRSLRIALRIGMTPDCGWLQRRRLRMTAVVNIAQ